MHSLLANIGHRIIRLILVVMVIIILVRLVHVHLCSHHRLIFLLPLIQHLLVLHIAIGISTDGNHLHYLRHLDLDRATVFDLGQPRLAYCRAGSVSFLVVILQLLACTLLEVRLLMYISQ